MVGVELTAANKVTLKKEKVFFEHQKHKRMNGQ